LTFKLFIHSHTRRVSNAVAVFLLFISKLAISQCTFGNFPPTYTDNSAYGADYLLGTSHVLTNSLFLTGLGFQGNNTGAGIKMALYGDAAGTPGTLIAVTNSGVVGSGNIVLNVITPTLLIPGTYWIMANYDQTANHVPKNFTATNTVSYISLSYSSAPPSSTVWISYLSRDFNYWAVSGGISAGGNQALCIGSSITLTASGGTSYTWNTGAFTSSILVNPTVTTVYSVTGAGASCGNSATTAVTVNQIPTVTAAGSSTICAGKAATLIASGASSYTWNGNLFSQTISPIPAGTTNYTVTGALNGCTASAVKPVSVMPLPALTISGSNTVCLGNAITLTIVGTASSYTWSNGSNSSTITTSPITNTFYQIIGLSPNNCVDSAATNITVFQLPTITISQGTICAGSSFTIVPSGASTYTYLFGGPVISPSASNSYSLVGSSAVGCTSSAVCNVFVKPLPTITVNQGTICAGNTFTIIATGGQNISYSGGGPFVNPVVTTSYVVSGMGINGCTAAAVCNVNVNPLPSISVIQTPPVMCKDQTGTISVVGVSTYTWNTGMNSSSLIVTGQNPLTFTISGTDVNGCSNQTTFIQSVSSCLGLVDNEQLEFKGTVLRFYPVPARENVNISYRGEATLIICSPLGDILQRRKHTDNTVINVDALDNGLYLLVVVTVESCLTGKFIVEK
jgi:hypothetical protein